MSKEQLVRLHNVYTSATYQNRDRDPRLKEMMEKPHLAIFINGDWFPVLPGMIIGLMRNIQHVDGIAPYKLRKCDFSPGKEFIDLVAYSSEGNSSRKLQFLANYSGVFRSSVDNADAAIDGVINSQKGADAVK